MTKYNEIMLKVSVTPEMRERVLAGIAKHCPSSKPAKAQPSRKSRRGFMWIPVAAAVCLLIVAVILISLLRQRMETGVPIVASSHSIEEYGTLEDLADASGFSVLHVPDIPFTVTKTIYTNAFGIARIDYYGAEAEMLTFSKAEEDGSDISGDHNEYASVEDFETDGVRIILKGNDGIVSLASWTKDGFAYAIQLAPGIEPETVKAIVETVISLN